MDAKKDNDFIVEDGEALRLMTKYFWIAAVARAMEPGCKFGHCLVFTGNEATARGFLENVFKEFFYDGPVDFDSVAMNGRMLDSHPSIVNIAGLAPGAGLRLEHIMDTRIAVERLGKRIELPREFITCATEITPALRPLVMDDRFWVVRIGERTEALPIPDYERDQMWAEALHYYRQGERYIPNDREIAIFAAAKRRALGMECE